jgi:hypothetical protein
MATPDRIARGIRGQQHIISRSPAARALPHPINAQRRYGTPVDLRHAADYHTGGFAMMDASTLFASCTISHKEEARMTNPLDSLPATIGLGFALTLLLSLLVNALV